MRSVFKRLNRLVQVKPIPNCYKFNNSLISAVHFSTNKSRMDELSKLDAASKHLAPSLDNSTNYKGQAGKIGIFGGSFEYTGAPYFAAIAALKVGADLSHVFCSKEAAVPIKCYSPELIVHPLLYVDKWNQIKDWIPRFDVILIGPGLGREESSFAIIEIIIEHVKNIKKPLIIDADGLFLIAKKPDLIRGFDSPVILTPNKMELARLMQLANPNVLVDYDASKFIRDSNWGDNVWIFSKGNIDQIINARNDIKISGLVGSGRRCGGQGDVLAGSMAVFLHWSKDKPEVAMYSASKFVRCLNFNAFKKKGRTMLAHDMIDEIHEVFQEHFERK